MTERVEGQVGSYAPTPVNFADARRAVKNAIALVRSLPQSREVSIAATHLDNGRVWIDEAERAADGQ